MESNNIAELLQAEKKAESLRGKSAEEMAARIQKARREADALILNEEQQSREVAKRILEESSNNAKKEALVLRAKGQKDVTELRSAAEGNKQKAVLVLMGNLDKAI